MHFTCSPAWVRQFKPRFAPNPKRTYVACSAQSASARDLRKNLLSALTLALDPASPMPQRSLRTEMLDELIARDRAIWRRHYLHCIAELLSDLSSDSSSSSSVAPRALTPISIDSSDIAISSDIVLSDLSFSDISMRLNSDDAPEGPDASLDDPNAPNAFDMPNPPNPPNTPDAPDDLSTSDTGSDSEDLISDFELEYFLDWRRRFRELFTIIATTRVLQPTPPIPKASQLHLLDHWRENSPGRFRRKLRVDPETFDKLVALISNNSVFSNNSNCPQLPVHIQLAIFLFRAGHYGNAASPEDIAQWAGVSVGAVKTCTDRVVVAILSLHDDAVHLPDAAEKEEAKLFVESQTCPEWRDGFLLVDGTKFAFFQRPGLHGDSWFDKDGEYSISCQVRRDIVCS
jgi:hypothetical protein